MSSINTNSQQELFARIKELEEEVTKLKSRKKYGLVWEDKPEDVVLECEKKIPVLKEIKNRKIVTSENSPTNLLIEGDNYHALSVLNYTHKGKIDVIYIDPPYNTGNKDFIYNDDYVDKEDSFKHSKWLSFMEKRLKLAKELLKDSGVIFISIDDNEQAQLKLLCDSVFGENNFVSKIVVESGEVFGTKAAHANKTFVKVKDYMYVYSKNEHIFDEKIPLYDSMRELYDSHFSNIINKDLSKENIVDFLKKQPRFSIFFDNLNLKINKENINKLMLINNEFTKIFYEEISDILYADAPFNKIIDKAITSKYKNGEPFLYEDKILFKTKTESIRMFLKFKDTLKYSDDYIKRYQRCSIRGDLWKGFHFDMRNVQDEAGTDFKNGKKPIRLISNLLKWFNKKNSIVLDFFAGSGSTGHAVLSLNNEDGGNRQFILVTNNGDERGEHKICEDITYPRIKNAINELGGNLEYLKCDFIDKTRHTDNMKMRLMRACSEMLCLKENTFELIKEIKDGETLMYRLYKGIKVHEDGNNKEHIVGIYYDLDDSYLDDMRSDLKNYQDAHKTAYIFSLRNVSDFIEDYRKWKGIQIEEVPQKILEIYESIYKRNNRT